MKNPATILAVDDQASFRYLLQAQLQDAGFSVLLAAGADDALHLLQQHALDLILSDLVMPGMDGLALLGAVRERFSHIPFIVLTSHGSIASAVEAMKRGAYDYVEKPCAPDELQLTIQRALQYQCVVAENEQFKRQYQEEYCFESIVTVSPLMKQALKLAADVTKSPRTTVALLGESGCGKEVLARAIHSSGGGLPTNFVGVNCAAIPATLLESELFGHVRGAFTGADRDREGKFSLAKGGTILLDEIGDMPLDLQAKLLRILEDRAFEKVGSNRPVAVECRIIVATNHDLSKRVQEGRFRQDLYHRINVFPIAIPPLRERREDIAILTEHFLKWLRHHLGKPLPGISQSAMTRLVNYHWPGNVRELRNCLERAAIIAPGGEVIRPEHLAISTPLTQPLPDANIPEQIEYQFSFSPDDLSLEAVTHRVLEITLQRCGGNKTKAADLLKVSRKVFYR